jgi:integrase/recombinase XerD
MSLAKAIDLFLLTLAANGYSKNTIELYRWALSIAKHYFQNSTVEFITSEKLTIFFAWLNQEYKPSRAGGDRSPLSKRSVENVWTAVRSFYNWYSSEFDAPRPDNKIKRPRYAQADITPYTEQEIKGMLQACEYVHANTTKRKPFRMKRPTAKRDVAIILILLDTGLRASELCRLRVIDLDQITGELVIHPWGSGQKTKPRSVYIGKRARIETIKYLGDRVDGPLFITERGNAFNRGLLRHLICRCAQRAGVKNATPHRFRHTFAIQYLRNSGDVFTLQRLLGHSSLDMVRRYLSLANADDQLAHRRASPVDNWRL